MRLESKKCLSVASGGGLTSASPAWDPTSPFAKGENLGPSHTLDEELGTGENTKGERDAVR